MMASSGKSWNRVLAIVLMSSLPAAAWVLSREPTADSSGKARTEAVPAVVTARASAEPARAEPGIGRIGREAKPHEDPVADVFERQNWEVAAPAESPPPVAPPLPFTYMGKVVEDGTETVFLTRDDRSYAVKSGETLDGVYRVEKIAPSSVTFTYLPLRQRQQLATGD
jgi:hypothetical protein